MAALIDSHAHLDYEYEISTDLLIEEAAQFGIQKILCIAAEPTSLERVEAIAAKYPNVFHTSGIHPHDATHWTPELFEKVKLFAAKPKCLAIGELGLDYFYKHSDQPTQFKALEEQLIFSSEIGKPIVVHSRDAEEDTLRFLKEHAKLWSTKHKTKAPGVIHCFTSSQKLAEECLLLGYFISFSGIITFKNADALREVVKIVPLDKLLVETDSPYLAPIPHRGKKNHPAYTKYVAEKVAELKGLSFDEVARITTENAIRLFGFPNQGIAP